MFHLVIRTGEKEVVMKIETMVGKTGTAKENLNPEGFVVVEGELWSARAIQPVHKGEKIVVLKKVEQYLVVKKKESDNT
ncbi:MAG: hypothetical protein NTX88_11865 [Candidatus Atribacteria bacterium]|nr:hypothetical protein [Candidatus Atribacteria bacterium]